MPPIRTASNQVEAALLDAAQVVLERDGLDAVTIRAVAAEAGVAPMGVYNRFTNKDGLLTALSRRAFDALRAAVDVREPADPVERLRASCRAYRTFALEHGELYGLLFSGARPLRPRTPLAEHGRAVFAVLTGLVEASGLAGPDAHLAARIVWNAIHGAAAIEGVGLLGEDDAAVAYEATLDVLIAGLGAPSELPARRSTRI